MKNYLLRIMPVTIVLYLVSSCAIDFNEAITGNGDIVIEKREIKSFDKLEVSSGLEVTITFGQEPSLQIEADKNLLEVISTDLNNGRLRITSKINIRRAKSKKIHLTVPDLHSIEVSGAGIVQSENRLKVEELKLEVSSAGRLKLEVEAGIVNIDVSSAANVLLKGTSEKLFAEVSSAGNLEAYDLVTEFCKVKVSSAGKAKVNTTEVFEAEASSAGKISYKGDPKETNIEKSSAGSVSRW
jgi:hypothetical protein